MTGSRPPHQRPQPGCHHALNKGGLANALNQTPGVGTFVVLERIACSARASKVELLGS